MTREELAEVVQLARASIRDDRSRDRREQAIVMLADDVEALKREILAVARQAAETMRETEGQCDRALALLRAGERMFSSAWDAEVRALMAEVDGGKERP